MAGLLAVVPARGGSKRIPRKNVRDFLGRPCMAWPLAAAAASGLFDEIHVSTEDDEIAAVAADLGHAPAFRRPEALAGDATGLMEVLTWVLAEYARRGRDFDGVALVTATAVLLEPKDLVAAHRLYAAHGGRRPVLAVAPYPAPVEWAFRMGEAGDLRPLSAEAMTRPSQSLEVGWYDTGTLIFFPAERVRRPDAALADFVGYALPKHKAVDLDDWEDWELALRLKRGAPG